ncbi:MAG: hypothetical protein MUC54_00200 [Chloroflexi bacterium]|jgi:hypothetical protein|nr:hypothetical protein [Chloroflexota bacterium]
MLPELLSTRLGEATRAGAALLTEVAAGRVAAFLDSRLAPDGGFVGRSGGSDVYYTYFALASLAALGHPLPWARSGSFLAALGNGRGLDLAHLACLARALALAPGEATRAQAEGVLVRMDGLVAPRGGFAPAPGLSRGTISASFVALLAHEELSTPLPVDLALRRCLAAGRCADGAWADSPDMAEGTTTVTAAAALLHLALDEVPPPETAAWLAARHRPEGGFLASPRAPVADLLSTAAALLALAALGAPLEPFALPTLDFVHGCWAPSGGFGGHPADPVPDSEHTTYALLALGVLAGELQ